jgi:hypothetical protein
MRRTVAKVENSSSTLLTVAPDTDTLALSPVGENNMLLRIKRAYYAWRLRLVTREILDTRADIFAATVCKDYDAVAEHAIWLEQLLHDKRRFEFRLAQLPQPT